MSVDRRGYPVESGTPGDECLNGPRKRVTREDADARNRFQERVSSAGGPDVCCSSRARVSWRPAETTAFTLAVWIGAVTSGLEGRLRPAAS
jgi:hypothetical protein